MADRGRQQIFVTLEVIALAHETTERACDVGGDRRLLCDDEFSSHRARKAGDDKCKRASGSTLLRQSYRTRASAPARARARSRALVGKPRVRRAEEVLGDEAAGRHLLVPQ